MRTTSRGYLALAMATLVSISHTGSGLANLPNQITENI
jgi:hypothetical protein